MTVGIAAQDVTHPSTTKTIEPPTHEVQTTHVKNAEVIHVSGHEVVVELENGKFELLNLADDVTFQVDGRDLTVHELTPGTKLSQEIHTDHYTARGYNVENGEWKGVACQRTTLDLVFP